MFTRILHAWSKQKVTSSARKSRLKPLCLYRKRLNKDKKSVWSSSWAYSLWHKQILGILFLLSFSNSLLRGHKKPRLLKHLRASIGLLEWKGPYKLSQC
jgi:hypothetical protein